METDVHKDMLEGRGILPKKRHAGMMMVLKNKRPRWEEMHQLQHS